jgi:tetratricopeptide (TPR) repeat protein
MCSMKPETWRQVEQLYHAALERDASERLAFLDRACAGDEALRREVEKLIAGHERAGTFLASPAWEIAASMEENAEQAEPLDGRSIGRYQVVSLLGRGGMGEVYLAQDTGLGRKVALKLLPARFTADAERVRRFEQEVHAVSALNHPNIVTVYDVGEAEAGRFIVMELVAGRTLRAVAGAGGPFSLDSLIDLAGQIAKALAVAHAAGIVHRDIKPENIMVRDDGLVKVLDFGLARLVTGGVARAGGETALDTRSGMLLGTMHYMSPEQVRAESVSSATDIFSLGIVFYELATGQHPFKADSQIGVLHSILSDPPPVPTRLNPEMSGTLERLILRMLEKVPRLRPTAAEVEAALADLRGTLSGRETVPSMVSEAQVDAGRQNVGVVARTRSASFVTVAVLLAVAIAGIVWWRVQDRVGGPAQGSAVPTPAASVATAPPVSAARPRVSSGGPASTNPEANRYFENAMQSKVVNDLPRQRQMLERALALDPHFAEARAWYGFTNWLWVDQGYSNNATLLYRAEDEMRRALQDEPSLARAHAGFAAVYMTQGRTELVPGEVEQALKTNPGDEDAVSILILYHQYREEYAAAERAGKQVLDRIPLFYPARMELAEMFRQQGNLAAAIREQERILEQDPQNVYALGYLARAYMDSGDLVKARQALDRVRFEDQQSYKVRRTRAILLALEGRRAEALKEMDEEVLKWEALVAYETAEAAEFYAVLGDASKALDWLDRAVRSGDERAEFFRRDPLLANVRSHPRFQQILESIAYRRRQRTPLQ